MNQFKIKIPIYGGIIHVIQHDDFNESAEKLNVKLKKEYNDGFNGLALRLHGNRHYAIFLTAKFTVGLIAHEATHIVNMLFEDIGYTTIQDNDEVQTYTLHWLCDEIVVKLKT